MVLCFYPETNWVALVPMASFPQGKLSPEGASSFQTLSRWSFCKNARPELGLCCLAGTLTRNKEEPFELTSSIFSCAERAEMFAMATSLCHSRAREHVVYPAILMPEKYLQHFEWILDRTTRDAAELSAETGITGCHQASVPRYSLALD